MKSKKGSSSATLLNINPLAHNGSIDPCGIKVLQFRYFVNKKKLFQS